MPKVIENLKSDIILIAKEELFNKGYKDLNMRNIAKRINTAVGTIYNYFPSKELLVASIILEDWLISVDVIKQAVDSSLSVEEALKKILKAIKSFYDLYADVFRSSGLPNVSLAYPDKHEMLLRSIEQEVKKLYDRFNVSYTDFEITFIVSNVFSSVTNNWPFEQIINILNKVVKE